MKNLNHAYGGRRQETGVRRQENVILRYSEGPAQPDAQARSFRVSQDDKHSPVSCLLTPVSYLLSPVSCLLLSFLLLASPTLADEPRLDLLKQVGIDQRLNAQLPPDLIFRDEAGRDVPLRQYFGHRPIILTLVYYGCPQLCTTVLNELCLNLNVLPDSIGRDFDVLTISFDPSETPELATKKKTEYLRAYRRPDAANGWHFLTGSEASIHQITSTVGFRYLPDPQFKGQFIHAGGIIVLTPSGKVSRYFYGINYAPRDLRLALADASEEKAGSLTNAILLYCFHYDPHTGRYTIAILNLLKVAAALTLLAMATFFVRSWRRTA